MFIQNVSLKIRRLHTETVENDWGYSVRERSIAYSGLVGEERVAVKRGVTSHLLENNYA
mgnify:FL=1